MDESTDSLSRRCPRLGGPVLFRYCRRCGEEGAHCFKIIDCWWEYFDIMAYLKANLPADTVKTLVNARPKPKLCSILELIEKAREKAGDSG